MLDHLITIRRSLTEIFRTLQTIFISIKHLVKRILEQEKNNQNQMPLQEQNVNNEPMQDQNMNDGRRYPLRNRKKTHFYGIN